MVRDSLGRRPLQQFRDGYLIWRSPLFDSEWYLEEYPDVAEQGFNPVLHYLRHGWLEARNPGPAFSTSAYLRDNPDVRNAGVNPLLHFETMGRFEGRAASPVPRLIPQARSQPAAASGKTRVRRWEGRFEVRPDWPVVMACAHISGHQLYGGERSFLDVLEGLRASRVNVVATLPSSNNPDYVEAVRSRSSSVYAFPYPQWREGAPEDDRVIEDFLSVIDENGVAGVHANTIMLREPLTAAGRRGCRRVIHSREIIDLDQELVEQIGLPVSRIVELVVRRCDLIIANSIATAACFLEASPIALVPNCIPAAEFSALRVEPGPTLRFAMISSNLPKKGLADFLEVARRCLARCPQAAFVVVGPENDYVASLRRSSTAGPVPENVSFVGYRQSPQEALAEADVVMNLSSFAESFGRTVAEAMAAGRAVIGYRWGALPELVEDGSTGLLAPYRDVDAVAEHVARLCAAPEEIPGMGERGRARIARLYSRELLNSRMAAAYSWLLRDPDDAATAAGETTLCCVALLEGARPVSVVVPVFNAAEHARRCVESALAHLPRGEMEILVIDDGSTDPAVARWLEEIDGTPNLRIHRNGQNLGYTRTVNRGLELTAGRDVVLLNSDTIVTPRWLQLLRVAAYLDGKVGTATAVSDNAGAFSVPVSGVRNPRPEGVDHDSYARSISRWCLPCRPVDVPTGSGFCMYVRRDLVDEIGRFDEQAFPRGYGEENDFCMRALNAGWRNVIAPAAFVYHVRSASFGSSREALVAAGVDVVTRRYPDYAQRVKAAFDSKEMNEIAAAARMGANEASSGWMEVARGLGWVSPFADRADEESGSPVTAEVRAAGQVVELIPGRRRGRHAERRQLDPARLDFRELLGNWLLRTSAERLVVGVPPGTARAAIMGTAGLLGLEVEEPAA